MRMTISEIRQLQPIDKLTLHSLESMLYQVSVESRGVSCWVADEQGQPYRTHSLSEMKDNLSHLQIRQVILQHDSSYDEMIGLDSEVDSSPLEVELNWKN